jgi:nucleoid DNA-binding protein
MVQLLYKYLILNKQVTLPGLGIFYIQRQPAKHDYVNSVFVSPALHINFNASSDLPDKNFYQFVSKERGLNEVEAVKSLNSFADKLNQQVKANKTVELPGMGMLKINAAGQLTFEPADILAVYFPPIKGASFLDEKSQNVTPEKAATNTSKETISFQELSQEEVSRKSYWWVYAIILALLGIGAIGYYYYVNGSLK